MYRELSQRIRKTVSNFQTPTLRLLTRSDLADIELEPSCVIQAVEDGYMALQAVSYTHL